MEWGKPSVNPGHSTGRIRRTRRANHRGRRGAGFTIPELLVVIGITVAMTGVLLVNVQRGRGRDVVRTAAEQLRLDIERQRSIARAGDAAVQDVDAYGIAFDRGRDDRYILFADRVACVTDAWGERSCAGNGQYDSGDATEPDETLPGGVVLLPEYVRIVGVAPASHVDVRFTEPNARLRMSPDQPSTIITLAHVRSGASWRVRVDAISGRVFTEPVTSP